jgi:hypothetical protein
MEPHALKRTPLPAVIPAKAGIQSFQKKRREAPFIFSCHKPRRAPRDLLDPDVRRDDGISHVSFQRRRFLSPKTRRSDYAFG